MSQVDIIIPVCGAFDVVKECLESLYPVPENWGVIIYLSKISKIDGTSDYLFKKQKELKFKLIDGDLDANHGKAVRALLKESRAPWVIHLDSDAKLLDRRFYSWVNEVIKKEKFKVWGRVDGREPMPVLQKSAKIRLLRMQSWNVLFEREYIESNNLEYGPTTIQGKAEADKVDSKELFIWGDTSWEYFWKASRDDLFGRYPDDMWACWEHKNHSSVDWKKANAVEIGKLKLHKKDGINMDYTNPPKSIEFQLGEEKILLNKKHFQNASTGVYYIDRERSYFIKVVDPKISANKLQREIVILNILKKYKTHFPRIIDYGENYVMTEYCGEQLTDSNIPKNVYRQIDKISSILKDEKIFHLDIKPNELLVKDNKVFLVDFGAAEVNLKSSKGRFPNDDFRMNYMVDKILDKADKEPRFKYGKENTVGKYQKFIIKARKHFGASQAQGSILKMEGNIASFEGYQTYKMIADNKQLSFEFSGHLNAKMKVFEGISLLSNKTILDLGCSNGAAGIWLGHKHNASEIHLYDHDIECISNIKKLSEWRSAVLVDKNIPLYPKEYSFSSETAPDMKYDYVMALATLHWFYSATTDIGCLYAIVKKLKDMTNIALIVEWVDVNDPTVHHIRKNPQIHKSPYNKTVFIEALNKNFSSYTKIGNTKPTRELFVAYI